MKVVEIFLLMAFVSFAASDRSAPDVWYYQTTSDGYFGYSSIDFYCETEATFLPYVVVYSGLVNGDGSPPAFSTCLAYYNGPYSTPLTLANCSTPSLPYFYSANGIANVVSCHSCCSCCLCLCFSDGVDSDGVERFYHDISMLQWQKFYVSV